MSLKSTRGIGNPCNKGFYAAANPPLPDSQPSGDSNPGYYDSDEAVTAQGEADPNYVASVPQINYSGGHLPSGGAPRNQFAKAGTSPMATPHFGPVA